MNRLTTFLAGAALSVLSSVSAQAAIVIYTWESGSDVLASFSGSLSGFQTGSPDFTIEARINPGVAAIYFGDDTITTTRQDFVSFSGSVGTIINAQAVTTDREGDTFGVIGPFFGNEFLLPVGYVHGTEISGSMRFANTDFATLGLINGAVATGTISGGDTITWRVGESPAAIPLPAPLSMVLASLGALAWLRRRTPNDPAVEASLPSQ